MGVVASAGAILANNPYMTPLSLIPSRMSDVTAFGRGNIGFRDLGFKRHWLVGISPKIETDKEPEEPSCPGNCTVHCRLTHPVPILVP